jgi:hypothetical protein
MTPTQLTTKSPIRRGADTGIIREIQAKNQEYLELLENEEFREKMGRNGC